MSSDNLLLVLGDQLDRASPVLAAGDRRRDCVLMIEARSESTKVWSHKARTALFLAAMRQHAAWLKRQGWRLRYVRIDQPEAASLHATLVEAVRVEGPRGVRLVEAGEYGVEAEVARACAAAGVALETLPDPRFLCSRDAFADWRAGRRRLVMEHFYRRERQRLDILMDGDQPAGGRWNFDRENRKTFGRQGPGMLPPLPGFAPDSITRGVLQDVARQFPDHPGSLDAFDWPVTREQALVLLDDFVDYRLGAFGPYQDAMWRGEPFLYHSALSAALNLKLLDPREVVDAAIARWQDGAAPLASVEGFVRQIVGWREFVRGIYWTEMPQLLERNALDAQQPLPAFYWNAATDMACLREVIGQTLQTGYAHHIQRLMVTGLFALLLGVAPRQVHEWYLAVYVDAVEWVEVPNTLGMSQFADGGLLASKPYAASGRYIQRMSNYCDGCRYRPDRSTGDDACPFTTLYWDFLMRHAARFAAHPRAALQWRNLERLDADARTAIRHRAARLRADLAAT